MSGSFRLLSFLSILIIMIVATKCSDYEALSDFAKKYQLEQPHVSAAASAKRSRIIRGDSDGAKSHGDLFADAVSDLF